MEACAPQKMPLQSSASLVTCTLRLVSCWCLVTWWYLVTSRRLRLDDVVGEVKDGLVKEHSFGFVFEAHRQVQGVG